MVGRKDLTMVAVSHATRKRLGEFRDKQEVSSYDAAINLLFDLVENLYKDLERVSPSLDGEKT